MQVEELFDLTTWINNEIVNTNIPTYYQNLIQILSFNQSNQTKQPFEAEKNTLINALGAVRISLLSAGQLEILEKVGIANHVGEQGIQALEETLFRNALDIATTYQKVNIASQDINGGIQWSNETRNALQRIIVANTVQDSTDTVLLRVHFQKDAHLSNLTEFKNWGKVWYDIGRGIAMAHGASPEDIQVVGASKGSIIITLATAYGIAHTTSFIILKALEVAHKILDIKKSILEIEGLKLTNNEAVKHLKKAVVDEKTNGIKTITEETIKCLDIKADGEGDKVSAVEASVQKLIDFIEKGGEVDFVIPDEVEPEDETNQDDPDRKTRSELRVMFQNVRQLEEKVKQIEHKA